MAKAVQGPDGEWTTPDNFVVIRKGGYFYREKWCGYTSEACAAGVYDREEAELHAATTEGVTVHPLSQFFNV